MDELFPKFDSKNENYIGNDNKNNNENIKIFRK